MRDARTWVIVCALLGSGGVGLGDPPYQPDQDTMLLMHLDGDVSEAAKRIPGAEAKGDLRWIDGAFGKAVALDGTNGVVVNDNGMLNIRDSSWTLEAWIKPEAEQPQNAFIIGSFPGLGRTYSLRLVGGKRLAARFGADDVHVGSAASGDISAMLLDGKWHNVAAVLDRSRNGEDVARQRIELFSKTFRYSEYLMDIANAKTVTRAQIDAVKKYAAEVIEPNPMTIHRGKDGVAKQLDQVLAVITKGKL